MATHISFLQDCTYVLLLYLFSIKAKLASHTLLDKLSQLPFLIKNLDLEDNLTNFQVKHSIVQLVKTKLCKLSVQKAKKRIISYQNSDLLAKAAPFIRPDLRAFLLEIFKEIVEDHFFESPCEIDSLFNLGSPCKIHSDLFRRRHQSPFPIFKSPSFPVFPDDQNPIFFHQSTILVGHKAPLFCLMYDHNGDRIITGSDDYLIKIWDVSTGYLIFTLNGHGHKISDFNLFEDGIHLISCDVEGFLVIWDISKGVIIDKRRVSASPISSVFFTPARYESHASVFATGENGCTYFLNLKSNFTFEQIHSTNEGLIYKDKKILTGSTNRTGTLIAYGGEDFMIHILMPKLNSPPEQVNAALRSTSESLNWSDPQAKFILHGHIFAVASLDFNSDGTRILSSSQDNSARVWTYDPDLNQWTCIVMGEEIDFNEDDGVVRHLQRDHKIKKEMPIGLENAVCSVAWASNDNLVIVSYDSGHMKIFCSYSGKQLFKCYWFDSPIHVIMAHPKYPDYVLCACYSGNVILWNCSTKEILKKWQFPDLMFLQGQFSPKGNHFSLSTSSGLCLTFLHTLDKFYQVPAISGQQQSFSHDFVNVPPNVSFPIHGTETRRNEFCSYELRNFDCEKYPLQLQQPDDFGKQFLVSDIGGQLNEPKITCNRIKHYKWESLVMDMELPKKFQYQKYRREHANLFIDMSALDALALEPVVLPPSPKDEDYIESSQASSEEEVSLTSEDSDYFSGSSSCSQNRRPSTRSSGGSYRGRKSCHESSKAYGLRRRHKKTESTRVDPDEDQSEYSTNEGNVNVDLEISSYPLMEGFFFGRQWASLINQTPDNYFPQINDIVVYFRSGHQEFLDTLDKEYDFLSELQKAPFLEYPTLKFNEEGIILGVYFKIIHEKPCVTIRIKFSGNRSCTITIDKSLPRFLTLQQLYVAASQTPFAAEDQVRTRGLDPRTQTIASVSCEDDPWNAIRLDNGNSYGGWELDLCEQNVIVQPVELPSIYSASQQAHITTIRRLARKSKFVYFANQIEFEVYPFYLDIIACPMFFSLILLRLINGFYRTEAAVLEDINLIVTNALTFNVAQSKIVVSARKLKKEFCDTLKQEVLVKEGDSLVGSALELSKSKIDSSPSRPGPLQGDGNFLNNSLLEGDALRDEADLDGQKDVGDNSSSDKFKPSEITSDQQKVLESSDSEEFLPTKGSRRRKIDSSDSDQEFVPVTRSSTRNKRVDLSDGEGRVLTRGSIMRKKSDPVDSDEKFVLRSKDFSGRTKINLSDGEVSRPTRSITRMRKAGLNDDKEEFIPTKGTTKRKIGSSGDDEFMTKRSSARRKKTCSSDDEFVPARNSFRRIKIDSSDSDESLESRGRRPIKRRQDSSEGEPTPNKNGSHQKSDSDHSHSEEEFAPSARGLKKIKVIVSSDSNSEFVPTIRKVCKETIISSDSDSEPTFLQYDGGDQNPSNHSTHLLPKMDRKLSTPRSTHNNRLGSVKSNDVSESTLSLRPRKKVNYCTSFDFGISGDEL